MSNHSSTIDGKISLLEHFWEHSADNMFVVSLDGDGDFVIEDINPAQEKNLNLNARTMRCAKIKTIFDAATTEIIESKYRRCLETQQPITEYETVILDGQERYWNTMIIPIIESSPPRKRIFGISREVTELEQAKLEVEALNHDLEKRVMERTVELEESNKKLHELAFYDELTGIGNRRYFELHAEKLIALVLREQNPAYLVMLDIDRFKQLNDTYGHPFGDTVLTALAKLLRESVRSSDVLCRYGGEEFFIMLPFTGESDALEFCARLQEGIRKLTFLHEGNTIRITVSMGVAALGMEANTLKELVRNVDVALYQAKRHGRDRVELYSLPTKHDSQTQ